MYHDHDVPTCMYELDTKCIPMNCTSNEHESLHHVRTIDLTGDIRKF